MISNRPQSKILNLLVLLVVILFYIDDSNAATSQNQEIPHTNNWAVIVDTSRFWFNYRHAANVLSIYRSVKRLGIPDRYNNIGL